jgi:transposase
LVHYPFGEAIFAIGVNNPLKVAGFDPALTGWFYPARDSKPSFGATTVSGWIERTLQTQPAGATHWSTRSLGKEVGVSKNTIHRAWQDHQLKPHLRKSFKLSRDPQFVEKLTDVVGVYLQPPKDAVVLCVDEKSQIQALDRSQPGLPLKRGRCGTFTHDYKRHGTTCLFAALHVGRGRVIAEHYPRHRHQEFLRFLRRLDGEFPAPTSLHLILDNYAIHGHPRVRKKTGSGKKRGQALGIGVDDGG